jgi:arginine decarboxylase
MQTYQEFIDQSVDFPQEGFEVEDNQLYFHGIHLMDLIQRFGTPLRFTYLPLIGLKIMQAKLLFQQAMIENGYQGTYTYCYCTKSSHFKHVLDECLANDVHLETSSAYDIPLIRQLEAEGRFSKDKFVVCNGFKPEEYMDAILQLRADGFHRVMPVIDNKGEFEYYAKRVQEPMDIGMRLAIEELPDHEHYTSRFGLPAEQILDFYKTRIQPHPHFRVRMLHFFTQGGIHDTPYFWNELRKAIQFYCRFRQQNPHLVYFNIGGGLPYKNSLNFDYDYGYMINQIVSNILTICEENGVPEPNIVSEFGGYTVSEASGVLFKVVARKEQNDREKWMMLDGSLMTTLPDSWALKARYILLPVNNWDAGYERVILGGNTCDSHDYYAKDAHTSLIFMPKETGAKQYIGFFHTGAYQQALSGEGGIHHCLIPTPRHVLIRRGEEGLEYEVFHDRQPVERVMDILGY